MAERYAVCLRTVDKWRKARILPYVKVGRVIRFDPETCDAILKRHFEIQGRATLSTK
jgi:hypothetical protein